MILESNNEKEDLEDKITFEKIKKVLQDRHKYMPKKID